MKTLKVAGMGVLALGLCVGAKSMGKDTGCRTRAETFLTGVLEVKVGEAYDKLLANSPQKQKKEAVEGLKEKTASMLAILGTPSGYELVREQRYGDSIIRLVYIFKYATGPIMWEFYFYKPARDWVLINIEFNDKLALLGEK